MMISADKVADGIISFADAELLPKMEGSSLWAAAAVLVLARKRLDKIMTAADNKLYTALGIMDENGNIDIDLAIEAAKEATRKQGRLLIELPMIGEIILSEQDFDLLHRHITGGV